MLTQYNLIRVRSSLRGYYRDFGRLPRQADGEARALCDWPPKTKPEARKKWQGPYLDREHAIDGWGRRIRLVSERNGQAARLVSDGRDGKPGTEDDISLVVKPAEW